MNNDLILQSTLLATMAHRGQTRKVSGYPYIVHPLRVAMLVSGSVPWAKDHDSAVSAAILHDVLEDTHCKIPCDFPSLVHVLVSELTREPEISKNDTMHKLVKGHTLTILIKMADMIDNLKDGTKSFDNGLEWAKRHSERVNILLQGAICRDDNMRVESIFRLQDTPVFEELKSILKEISK